METDTLPFQQQKREALTRRANKLIEWLQRPQYAIYKGSESITNLIKVIDLIIWALERSVVEYEWKLFEHDFLECRGLVQDIFETEEAEQVAFDEALKMTIVTLRRYHDFILEYKDI